MQLCWIGKSGPGINHNGDLLPKCGRIFVQEVHGVSKLEGPERSVIPKTTGQAFPNRLEAGEDYLFSDVIGPEAWFRFDSFGQTQRKLNVGESARGIGVLEFCGRPEIEDRGDISEERQVEKIG